MKDEIGKRERTERRNVYVYLSDNCMYTHMYVYIWRVRLKERGEKLEKVESRQRLIVFVYLSYNCIYMYIICICIFIIEDMLRNYN